MALALAARGADVIITSRGDACEAVAAEIEALGRRAMAYGCHVGHWDEIDALVEAACDRFGKIDILINNAGMSPLYESLSSISEELFDKVIGVNLKGPFRLMAVVGERGGGMAVSSTSAVSPAAAPVEFRALWRSQVGLKRVNAPFAFALVLKLRTALQRVRFLPTFLRRGIWQPLKSKPSHVMP